MGNSPQGSVMVARGVRFAGEGGQGGGDVVDVGLDVGGGGGVGDGIAKIPFDPRQGGVAQPVCGDVLAVDPGQVAAESVPEVVIAAIGDGFAVGVAQQRTGGVGGAAVFGVAEQMIHQGGGDRLPAHRFPLLPQTDEVPGGVEVLGAQVQGTAAAAGGLGVQPQQQGVEFGVVAGGARDGVDLGESGVGERGTGRGQPAGFGDLASGVVSGCDQA